MLVSVVCVVPDRWTVVLVELLGGLLGVLGAVEPMLALSVVHCSPVKEQGSVVVGRIAVSVLLVC